MGQRQEAHRKEEGQLSYGLQGENGPAVRGAQSPKRASCCHCLFSPAGASLWPKQENLASAALSTKPKPTCRFLHPSPFGHTK